MSRAFGGVLRERRYRNLWTGQTISMFGSQITIIALPLAATLTLHASAWQMGLLRAASTLPALVFGLFVGGWIDRQRRRPVLIGADLARALLLGSIPIAAIIGLLTIWQLLLVAFLAGICTLLFDVADMSLLPFLVRREELVEGNSKLEVSRSGAMIIGPGVAGLLIQILTAPIVIIFDAVSYVGSAWFIRQIVVNEATSAATQRSSLWRDAREGLTIIARQPILRTLAVSLACYNGFASLLNAVYVLFVIDIVHVTPAQYGLISALGSVGFFIGASLAARVARWFGVGGAIVWGAVVSDMAFLLIPLADRPLAVAIPLLIAAQFGATLAGPITSINQLSLRQAIVESDVLGRVNGTMRFISASMTPLGAIVGGVLGEHFGVAPTILLGAIGIQIGFVILLVSPLRRLSQLPPSRNASV